MVRPEAGSGQPVMGEGSLAPGLQLLLRTREQGDINMARPLLEPGWEPVLGPEAGARGARKLKDPPSVERSMELE